MSKQPYEYLKDFESVFQDLQMLTKVAPVVSQENLDDLLFIASALYKPYSITESIIDEIEGLAESLKEPRKLILKSWLSPGDIVCLSHAVRDLHETFPGKYITDTRTPVSEIFQNNPFITRIDDKDPEATLVEMHYDAINRCNTHPVQMVSGYTEFLEDYLGVKIKRGSWSGTVFLSESEKNEPTVTRDKYGADIPYWIINAGYKKDFTCKTWSFKRYQSIVNEFPKVVFIQVGAKEHVHPELKGKNVIDMRGKTNHRELIKLIYHAQGIITAVSYAMHLAYSVPKKNGRSPHCIVLAGGREPNVWEQGPSHYFIHTLGMLSCCRSGACWRSRVVPIGDGDEKDVKNLCEMPVKLDDGQTIPKCMDLIKTSQITNIMKNLIGPHA